MFPLLPLSTQLISVAICFENGKHFWRIRQCLILIDWCICLDLVIFKPLQRVAIVWFVFRIVERKSWNSLVWTGAKVLFDDLLDVGHGVPPKEHLGAPHHLRGHHVHLEVQLCKHGGAGVRRGPKFDVFSKFGVCPDQSIGWNPDLPFAFSSQVLIVLSSQRFQPQLFVVTLICLSLSPYCAHTIMFFVLFFLLTNSLIASFSSFVYSSFNITILISHTLKSMSLKFSSW